MQPLPCCPQNVFSIFLGDAKTMNLKAVYADTLGPLDLTSCSEINVQLPNATGTFTSLLYSLSEVVIVSPTVLGLFNVPITSVVSALLNPGELQSFFVTFTISGNPFTVQYNQALTVLEAD